MRMNARIGLITMRFLVNRLVWVVLENEKIQKEKSIGRVTQQRCREKICERRQLNKKVYYRCHCEWYEKDTLYESCSLLPLSWVTVNAFDAFAIYFHFLFLLFRVIDDNVILWHWNRKNDTLMRLRPYWTKSFDYVIASGYKIYDIIIDDTFTEWSCSLCLAS